MTERQRKRTPGAKGITHLEAQVTDRQREGTQGAREITHLEERDDKGYGEGGGEKKYEIDAEEINVTGK